MVVKVVRKGSAAVTGTSNAPTRPPRATMVIWNILDESCGASQPASHELDKYVAQCVGIKLVRLGLHVAGARARARKSRDVLAKLGHP